MTIKNYSVSLDKEEVDRFRELKKKTHASLSPVLTSYLKIYNDENSGKIKKIAGKEELEIEKSKPSLIKPMKPIPIIPKHFEEIKSAKRFNRI